MIQFNGLMKKKMICIEGAGDLEGLQVQLRPEMIAKISFNALAGHSIVKLKNDHSCQLLTNRQLAGYLPHGSIVTVQGTSEQVKKKLGLSKRQLPS